MFLSGLNNVYGNQANGKAFGIKAPEKTGTKESRTAAEKNDPENPDQREDSLEISLEGRLAAAEEQEGQTLAGSVTGDQDPAGPGAADPETSEKQGGRVGVNEGKRARQIAAAKSRGQVQQVLALLQKDLSDCKAGLEKGWCDESEIAKVEALINQAKARLSQVPQENSRENGQGGLDEFAMASLM